MLSLPKKIPVCFSEKGKVRWKGHVGEKGCMLPFGEVPLNGQCIFLWKQKVQLIHSQVRLPSLKQTYAKAVNQIQQVKIN